jgi:NTE family protein
VRTRPDIHEMLSFGCTTLVHMMWLLAPKLANENYSKYMDFSAAGIRQRWEAGYAQTMQMLERAPWREPVGELDGFIVHDIRLRNRSMERPDAAP